MNRQVFFLNHGKLITAYNQIHAALEMLPARLCVKRDVNGKTMVSFIPFMALMSRQTLIGFDHLVSNQPYQAWMAVRPAVEIPLMVGKWLDDPNSAEIWKKREAKPKPYMKEYGSGKAMVSTAVKSSSEIQRVLKTLNDQFVHPNPYYYYRHLEMASVEDGKVSIEVNYFDSQETLEPHTLAFLHLTCYLHDSLREALGDVLGGTYDTEPMLPSMENTFGERANEIRKDDEIADRLLTELGCWPQASTN